MGRNTLYSAQIVAAATRIIEVTRSLDDKLDEAQGLVELRRKALDELERLTDVAVGTQQLPRLNFLASLSDAVLTVMLTTGSARRTVTEITDLVGQHLQADIPDEEVEKALGLLVRSHVVSVEDGRYYPGRSDTLRMTQKKYGLLSINSMTIEVLREAGIPLATRHIRQRIRERFGREIPRTTLQPMLAKLAKQGVVEHIGATWMLPIKV